ncbi:MAG: hypothetical protein V3V92_02555 [Candidatus Hydrothermarchaeales archaeon]
MHSLHSKGQEKGREDGHGKASPSEGVVVIGHGLPSLVQPLLDCLHILVQRLLEDCQLITQRCLVLSLESCDALKAFSVVVSSESADLVELLLFESGKCHGRASW